MPDHERHRRVVHAAEVYRKQRGALYLAAIVTLELPYLLLLYR